MATGSPTTALTLEAKNIFKQELNLDLKTTEEAMNNPTVLKYVSDSIEKANNKAVSRAAHVRKFKILPLDFSLKGGEFTPTLKLKRKVSENKYKALVDEMFAFDAKL